MYLPSLQLRQQGLIKKNKKTVAPNAQNTNTKKWYW